MAVSVELNTSRLTRPLIGCLPRPRTNWDEWDDRMLILNRYWTTKCIGKHYTPLALNQETSTFYDLKLLSFVVTHRESSKNHPYPHLDMSFPSYEHMTRGVLVVDDLNLDLSGNILPKLMSEKWPKSDRKCQILNFCFLDLNNVLTKILKFSFQMLNDANAGREWAPVKTYRNLVQIQTHHFRPTSGPLSVHFRLILWNNVFQISYFLFLFFDHLVSFILLSTLRLFQTQELSSFRIRKTILEHSVYSRPNKKSPSSARNWNCIESISR